MTAEATTAPALRTPLDAQALSTLFLDARTANSFADTPVTDEQLTAIWDLAKWAPTGANCQPLRVTYVRTPDGKERLVKHMAEGNRAKTLSAPVTAVLAFDPDYHETLPVLFPHAPAMKDRFGNDPVLRDANGRLNAALQIGYFVLAVRAAGLVAGPMSGFDAAGMDAEFFPAGDRRSLVVVNIGHPGENPWFGRLPRLEHDAVIGWH